MSIIIIRKQPVCVVVLVYFIMILFGCKQNITTPKRLAYTNEVPPVVNKLHGHMPSALMAQTILKESFGNSALLEQVHIYANVPATASMQAPIDFSWPISISFAIDSKTGQRLITRSFGPTGEHLKNKNTLKYFIEYATRTFGATLSHYTE